MLVIPLVTLILVESVLRLANFGHATSFLIRTSLNGQSMMVENPWFGLSFFPPGLARTPNPTRFAADKPSGVRRIFIFGESAALGDPRPAYGVGRYLRTLLEERFPGTRFEVVCMAMTAINSHALLRMARECAGYQGDLWILYMGNNEFAGPFGANTVFGPQAPPIFAVRTYLALENTRIGQGLVKLARGLHHSPSTPASWGGLKMFLDHQLPPEDPRRARVYHNFQSNLEDLLDAAKRAAVPVVLSTVASNLKDCAPFGSYVPAEMKGAQFADWKKAYDLAVTNATQRRFPEAIDTCRKALELNPTSAGMQFQLGQCLLATTNFAAARQSFGRARDLDTLPFRADTRINEIICREAKERSDRGVSLLDAEEALSPWSTSGIPGGELFYEHVHLNAEGNYHLALAFANQAIKCLPATFAKAGSEDWVSFAVCNQRLGLTDWNRYTIYEEILRRLSEPPFTGQLDHNAQMERLTDSMTELRQRMNRSAAEEARSVFVAAVERRPDDHFLHHSFAEFLTNIGDLPGATKQMRIVCDLLPQDHASFLQLGRLLARQKQYAEATSCLETALRLRPDLFDVDVELGQALAAQDKLEEALLEYTRAQRAPGQDEARVLLLKADVLARQHKRSDAIRSLQQAVSLRPDYCDAHDLLGIELALEARYPEAQAEFEEVVRLRPDYAEGHLNLGIALARQRRFREALDHFETTLRLDPKNAQASEFLSTIKTLQAQPSPQ